MTREEIVERLFEEPCPHGCYKDGTELNVKADCRVCIQSLLTEAEQRAAAGMQAAAVSIADEWGYGDGGKGETDMETVAEIEDLKGRIRSLTQADGTNALQRLLSEREANTRIECAKITADAALSGELISKEELEREKAKARLEEGQFHRVFIYHDHSPHSVCADGCPVWHHEQRIAELEREAEGNDTGKDA